jgi:hypothetical protein
VLAAVAWGWRRLSASGGADTRDSLGRLREALAAGEPGPAAASAARALREAVEVALPGTRDDAAEEPAAGAGGLAASGDAKARERAALLERIDAARFGGAEPERLLALAREAEHRLSGR